MIRKIEKDHSRFREIVRGRIKKDLRKYISSDELIGRRGKHSVSIPVPQIELPHFHYGANPKEGVGQGDGEAGSPVDGDGEGANGAGEAEGKHILEVEVSLGDLAKILGEELQLPNIRPKGRKQFHSNSGIYTGISRVGPESLRHFKRTYKQALKRSISQGIYDPDNPIVVPAREDRRYRAWKMKQQPESSAVVIYMMDVSGSMGKEQKEIVRIEAFWIDTWLRSQYKNLEVRYIVHDAVAHEVDQDTFFHLRESGGTKISSAFELCLKMVDEKFPPNDWNIYPFHFSDGDNWSARDTDRCVQLLREQLIPRVNLFCYGQVKSAYGSGQFKKDLDTAFPDSDSVLTSDIPDREAIVNSIQYFLGKGH